MTYEILPIAGLSDNTEIKNTAHIIFDSNPAVVTNTTLNTMVAQIPSVINEPSKVILCIQPNPSSGIVNISIDAKKIIDKILIYNELGQIVLVQKAMEIDLTHLPKEIFFVKIMVGDVFAFKKLLID